MYINKIVIKNIRCFDNFEWKPRTKGESALFVGDNGTGKSTLLRSIAISLCDISSAAALFREIRGKFIRTRDSKKPSFIKIYLSDPRNRTYIIKTEFHLHKGRKLERLNQKVFVKEGAREKPISQDNFPWHRIFVAGYGAGARTLGSGSIETYATIDAVYGLFQYGEPLQNPELALRRLEKEVDKKSASQNNPLDTFFKLLEGVLNFQEKGKSKGKVYFTKAGIEVRGPWGRSQLETLGDGYKSMIIWVLDLIGRRMLFGRTLDPKKMRGIVLLDEVEQHLHPRWQLNVMQLLTEAFPRIQFIATTHSPLVITGSKTIPVHTLGEPESFWSGEPIYGWRAEDVYRDVMGLDSSRPDSIVNDIHEYRRLDLKSFSKKISKTERREMERLKKKLLKTLHGSDPLIKTIELENIKNHLVNSKKVDK